MRGSSPSAVNFQTDHLTATESPGLSASGLTGRSSETSSPHTRGRADAYSRPATGLHHVLRLTGNDPAGRSEHMGGGSARQNDKGAGQIDHATSACDRLRAQHLTIGRLGVVLRAPEAMAAWNPVPR